MTNYEIIQTAWKIRNAFHKAGWEVAVTKSVKSRSRYVIARGTERGSMSIRISDHAPKPGARIRHELSVHPGGPTVDDAIKLVKEQS